MERQSEQTDLHGPDQPDPETRSYEINVANEHFESRTIKIRPYEATGQGLIEALGYKPIDAYVVLRYRADGSLEEIGLEESFDIAEPPRNSFFVKPSLRDGQSGGRGRTAHLDEEVIRRLAIGKQLARKPGRGSRGGHGEGEEPPVLSATMRRFGSDVPDENVFVFGHPSNVKIKVNNNEVKTRHGWCTAWRSRRPQLTRASDTTQLYPV